MTTIADVAAKAAVSSATVSRALNDTAVVAPETRQRVLKAVAALDYHPNQTARNLRRNRTSVILILTPNMTNPFYASILTGIGDTATALGFSAFICNTADDVARSRAALDRLRLRQADGAIVLSVATDNSWLTNYADRAVVQCAEFLPGRPIPHVSIDNYAASRDVMAHLLALGHRRIAHVSADNGYQSTAARLAGYEDAIADAGLEARPQFIVRGSADYSFASGKQAALQLLRGTDRPTAVYCISDTLALGAVVAAQELGLTVPDDVSVTGFDNVTETEMIRPHLTTLEQPCYDLGCTATHMLNDLLNDRAPTLECVLPHRLVLRESSAPVPPEPLHPAGAPTTTDGGPPPANPRRRQK